MPLLDWLRRTSRNAHLWLPGYLVSRWRRRGEPPLEHVWVTIADHFEPLWKRPSPEVARERVAFWRRQWPKIAARHQDSSGRPPQYGFFYPEEEYEAELMEPLAEMTRLGIADVEVHLHHDADTPPAFMERVGRFVETLQRRHGLLRRHGDRVAFGFIHGNWALDNARPDGRWCGLNNEISLLRELGCYADFTMPAAPDPSQAGPVNSIYRVTDDPSRPRSHARGVVVKVGAPALGDLTLIPGPLGVRWNRGRLKPLLDTGELAAYAPPSIERARLWLRVAPRIGRHAFVKLFGHGAQERNADHLLRAGLDTLFGDLHQACSELGAMLHYVTAWEMWLTIESLRQPPTPREPGRSSGSQTGRSPQDP